MKLSEFGQLDEKEQVKVLRQYGVYLSERIVGGNRIYLYIISSFYIELFHELLDTKNGGIRILRAFEDTGHLDAYLNEVDISSLSIQ